MLERKNGTGNGHKPNSPEVFRVLKGGSRPSDHDANQYEYFMAVQLPNGDVDHFSGEGDTPDSAFHRAFHKGVSRHDPRLERMRLVLKESHTEKPNGQRPKAVVIFRLGDQTITSTVTKASTEAEAFERALPAAYNKARKRL